MMFLGAPWQFWTFAAGPILLIAARLITWAVLRRSRFARDSRPGYLDLTKRP